MPVKKTATPEEKKAAEQTAVVQHEGVSAKKTVAVAVKKEQAPAPFNAETLIAQAIDKNVPVETMEKLLSMRRELKAEWAKEQFDKAMAQFQAECPTIVKTKEVKTTSGQVAYRYAPIESIVEQVKEALQKNGFSYSTSMEVLPAGVRVTVKVTHKDGHSETTPMEVPLGNKTNVMSASQVTAAATTFAKRYAFCNAFGILTGDEDTDAAPDAKQAETQKNEAGFTKLMTMAQTATLEALEEFKAKIATSEKYTAEQKAEFTKLADARIKTLKDIETATKDI